LLHIVTKEADTQDELNHLEEEYRKNRSAFVVIYGRRRIGKTTLIEEFGKDKTDFIYYLADQQTSKPAPSR